MARLFLIAAMLFCLGGMESLVWAGASKPKGELRIHLQVNGDTGEGSHATSVNLTDPDETIAISALPELTDRELEAVEPIKGDESMGVILKFERRGKLLLNTLTNQGQGRIMVVFLNGRVVYSPVIDSQITDGNLVIPRGVTAQDLEVLRQMVKGKK